MIKEKIISFLSKHKRMNYIQRCVRRINDDDFVQKVLDIDRDPMMIKFHHLGELHPEEKIYLLEIISDRSAGFCAYFRWTLNLLQFADSFHLTAVVYYGEGFLYKKDETDNGIGNGFEDYFKPVSHITVEEARQSRYVTFASRQQERALLDVPTNGYSTSDHYIENRGQICKKYIRLNDAVKEQFDVDIPGLLAGKKTLAIQVRGTDFNLNFNDHPVSVAAKEYLPLAHNAMEQGGFEQIFLATDEVATIDLFRKEFGEAVVYYQDTVRSTDCANVIFASPERVNNKYLLGLEVLRDVWTLASCDGLIAGQSNVSISARVVKASFDQQYTYLHIIDKGINHNNNECSRYYLGKL